MRDNSRPCIRIDLNEFKLHLHLEGKSPLTLYFNSPSRSFYLSVIALVVNEMKKAGRIKSIPLLEHLDLLALLNESVGGSAGSSNKANLLPRVYRKWKNALPNLEGAPLFKVLGKKREEENSPNGKVYSFRDSENDGWANLFDYMGSDENVRLRFAIDKVGVGLNDISIAFGDASNGEAWDQFIASLKKEGREEPPPMEESVAPEPLAVPLSPPGEGKFSWLSKYRWVLILVVMGIAAVGMGRIFFSPARIEVASVDRMKYPLPDKPSIAVLPFVDMSEDPKQEFICDGIAEEIITAFSRVPNMFVVARNSTFTYKGKPVKAQQVSEDLGVRYVLEGSVRRSGDRVRITVQLIDALKGNHLWAERYDRELKDLFALQDEITLRVLAAIKVKLTDGGQVGGWLKYYIGGRGLDCYLKFIEANDHYTRWNIEDNNLARKMIEQAIELCPEIPMGYIHLGWVYHHDYMLGNTKAPRETLEKAIELAQKAIAMDDSIFRAHGLLCVLYVCQREYDRAIAEGERAVALNPGWTPSLVAYGDCLNYAGRPEEAIPLFQKAIRLNPFGPNYLYRSYGHALRNAGRFEEAVSAFKKAIQLAPDNLSAHSGLAITYMMMGREDEARAEAAEVLRINPKYSVNYAARTLHYKDRAQNDKVINALRAAGLK